MKRKGILTALLAFVCLMCACSCSAPSNEVSEVTTSNVSTENIVPVTRELFAMDTYMSVTAYGERAEEAVNAAVDEIKRLDALLSVGDENSLIYRLNHGESVTVSEDITFLTEKSKWIYDRTEGAYDITIYPLMQLWGFTGSHQTVPTEEDVSQTLLLCGFDKLNSKDGIPQPENGQGIDFGGIAKGYTSQRIMDIFGEYKVVSGVVSLGGNVQCYGTKTDGSWWRCGITDPDHPQDSSYLSGVVRVKDKAVITSGSYERFFEENGKTYHHIMDPQTGYPAESGLKSVTIISEDGTLADGLSTACFVMGKERSVSFWREHSQLFDMILITEHNDIFITAGIKDYFTSDEPCKIIE